MNRKMFLQTNFNKAKIFRLVLLQGILLIFSLTAHSQQTIKKNGQSQQQTIKNLILMIGDGMGPQQLGLLQEYARRAKHSMYKDRGGRTALDKFADSGFVGLSRNGPEYALVVDSACSASQLASGISSGNEMIGLDRFGNPVETILEKAKRTGKATGLVSDTRISHATPAAFASHQRHRSLENEISLEMLSSNNVDVMLSGGLRHWLPTAVNADKELRLSIGKLIDEPGLSLISARDDEQNLLRLAQQQGYSLAFNKRQLQRAQGNKVLGLFASSGMLDAIAYKQAKINTQPSLAEMTKKALDILADDPDGFFLMVEGGQIDWAGHNNDAGTLLHEMLRFEQAVAEVYEWVKERSDTLVVITADHETGGFGFSYSRYQVPEGIELPGKMFEDHKYRPNFNFGSLDILDRLYSQKKSFVEIWKQAAKGPELPTADGMMSAINANSEFKVNLKQAQQILQQETNEYQQLDNTHLRAETFPKINDFKEFYVYGKKIHLDLIGRQLAKEQNIVWSTGTHTHTPVPVIAWGPEQYSRQFSTLSHHTDIGEWMIDALVGD